MCDQQKKEIVNKVEMDLWNTLDLPPPPATSSSCSVTPQLTDNLERIGKKLKEAEKILNGQYMTSWNTEKVLLERLLYKNSNQMKRYKWYQTCVQLRQCIRRLDDVDVEKILTAVMESLPRQWMVSEDSVYLPTRAVTNHARVRLLGAAILARRASILCMTTYRIAEGEMMIGMQIDKMLIISCLVSRMWILCDSLTTYLRQWYKVMVQLDAVLPPCTQSWLPDNVELPDDLQPWLDHTLPKPPELESSSTIKTVKIMKTPSSTDDMHSESANVALTGGSSTNNMTDRDQVTDTQIDSDTARHDLSPHTWTDQGESGNTSMLDMSGKSQDEVMQQPAAPRPSTVDKLCEDTGQVVPRLAAPRADMLDSGEDTREVVPRHFELKLRDTSGGPNEKLYNTEPSAAVSPRDDDISTFVCPPLSSSSISDEDESVMVSSSGMLDSQEDSVIEIEATPLIQHKKSLTAEQCVRTNPQLNKPFQKQLASYKRDLTECNNVKDLCEFVILFLRREKLSDDKGMLCKLRSRAKVKGEGKNKVSHMKLIPLVSKWMKRLYRQKFLTGMSVKVDVPDMTGMVVKREGEEIVTGDDLCESHNESTSKTGQSQVVDHSNKHFWLGILEKGKTSNRLLTICKTFKSKFIIPSSFRTEFKQTMQLLKDDVSSPQKGQQKKTKTRVKKLLLRVLATNPLLKAVK